mgnify:CR=1 FL=1
MSIYFIYDLNKENFFIIKKFKNLNIPVNEAKLSKNLDLLNIRQ